MINKKFPRIKPAYGCWINDIYQKPLHERKGKRWLHMNGNSKRRK